jgi:hypothetical protein
MNSHRKAVAAHSMPYAQHGCPQIQGLPSNHVKLLFVRQLESIYPSGESERIGETQAGNQNYVQTLCEIKLCVKVTSQLDATEYAV